ncbi:MAG TPA: helix-turn-helix transcriptional regulator [Clostridia bacterium]|nr:helix-turn-helix transcriptional regulator [Clostridia bacterium]
MGDQLSFTLEDLKSVMKSLANHFGAECEIVLHDFSEGMDSSVIAIENGHVTGRNVGSSITTSGLETLSQFPDAIGDGIYNYFSTTTDGKLIRSSSAVLRRPDGTIRGSLCINQDITKYRMAEELMRSVTRSDVYYDSHEVFFENVDQLLDHYIVECATSIGRQPAAMNKEELHQAIRFLEEKGVFRITKAGERVCSAFGITKYQLYRQLDAVRGEDDKKAETE